MSSYLLSYSPALPLTGTRMEWRQVSYAGGVSKRITDIGVWGGPRSADTGDKDIGAGNVTIDITRKITLKYTHG